MLKQGQTPSLADDRRRKIRLIVHIELTLLFVIMLLAVMMARIIGFFG
jgi:uncharacterized membrane protein